MKTIVVNIKKEKCDVFIGRPSIFGNRFVISRDGTREEVIEKHKIYFYERLATDLVFKRQVLALKGKKLGCYCTPLPCHGDTIAGYLNSLPD